MSCKDAIHEAEAKLDDVEREDRELTRVRAAGERNPGRGDRSSDAGRSTTRRETSRDKLKIAERIVVGADRLRRRSIGRPRAAGIAREALRRSTTT